MKTNQLYPTLLVSLLTLATALIPQAAAATEPTSPAEAAPSTLRAESAELTALVEQATDAYNQADYDQARQAFIRAIQIAPQNPDLYRNLARTFFWQNDYAAATAYYDFYLRLAPANAPDLEQIHGERRLAATRAGMQVWQTPEQQRLVLQSLNDQLDEGRAYTAGGGGAWSLYQTLIRTQFAQPELAQLKKRLVRRLFDEIESQFVVPTDQPSPRLDLEDWKVQRERIEATRSLTDDEVILDALQRRLLIVQTAESLLLARYADAVQQAELAMRNNPDIIFTAWFQITALLHSQRFTRALAAIDELEPRLRQNAPTLLDYAQILRAAALQKNGQHNDAATIYSELLAP